MDKISKGSTPLVKVNTGTVNPNSFVSGYLTFSQGYSRLSTLTKKFEVPLSDLTVSTNSIEYTPTQSQMILLDPTMLCFVQFRAADADGKEAHTEVSEYHVSNILHAEVIG